MIDRFLVSPVARQALISGRLVQVGIVSLLQSLIVIALGLLVGAHFPGGVTGLAVLVGCSAMLGASLGALSNGMALLARKVEWTVQAGRETLTANPDWGLVLSRAGLLAALCLACTWLATRAFRTYQRSI